MLPSIVTIESWLCFLQTINLLNYIELYFFSKVATYASFADNSRVHLIRPFINFLHQQNQDERKRWWRHVVQVPIF